MSRKLFIIIIGIILGVVLIYIFVATQKTVVNPDGTTTKSGLSSLFPFLGTSSTPPVTTVPSDNGGTTPTPPENPTPTTPSNLKKISTRVLAGFTILPLGAVETRIEHSAGGVATTAQQDPAVPFVRIAEAGTGYIYTLGADGKNETKTSDTLIARALDAFFGDSGNAVAVRYIKDDNKTVATFMGTIKNPAADASIGTIQGAFLPDNIIDMVVSPDQKSFFYVAKTASGSVGSIVAVNNSSKKQIFTSPLSEWLVGYTKGGQTVTAKAASGIPGYMYSITANGTLSKIIGDINGLTTLTSPDGKSILYDVADSNGLHLYARNTATGASANLNLSTLPEKCTWSKDSVTAYCGAPETLPTGTYPDDWYQGISHFSDSLWRINTASGLTTKLVGDEGNYLDVVHAVLDTNERFFVFINKNDNSLWSLDLTP